MTTQYTEDTDALRRAEEMLYFLPESCFPTLLAMLGLLSITDSGLIALGLIARSTIM